MIVSFFVVSLIIIFVESPIILVESLIMDEESLIIVDEESVTVADDSVDSVLVLEQAVANAIIESRKNADFFMVATN